MQKPLRNYLSDLEESNMITILTKPVPVNQKYGVINGRMLLQKKYRDTKEAIAWEIRSGWKGEPLTEDVAVNVIIYFGNNRANDIDNYLKIILDAAEGILFENDSQITELHVFKEYDKENPRVELSAI